MGRARAPDGGLAIGAAVGGGSPARAGARTTCAVGEISRTGQIRPVPQLTHRLREAARLGFTRAIVPAMRAQAKLPSVGSMDVIEVSTVRDALNSLTASAAARP